MPQKAARRRAPRKTTARQRRSRTWLKWLIGVLMLSLIALGGYSLYLGQIVRVKFEGKRWMLPARVYARPLELFVGADVSVAQLQAEFKRLGYRKVRHPVKPAQWSQSGGRFVFRTRAFQYWDGIEPARQVSLRIEDGRVSELQSAGQALDLFRLEPPEIGSIYPSHKEDRVLLRRDDLPETLVAALLAAEDRDYFDHHGVSITAIARALWADVKARRMVQGGSTLTQQLVKNFYLTPERSLWRKFNEALMAVLLDARYSKDEILEAYANEVYLGQDGERAIHGFGLASWFYFNRPLKELNLPEMALLVGLLKGASYYNPVRHPQRALERRNLVLRLMAEQGFISPAIMQRAQSFPLGLSAGRKRSKGSYPAFIDLVKRQLRRDYEEADLTSEGLRIFTTLDPWIQQQVDTQVAAGLQALEKQHGLPPGSLQAAMVVVSPQGGEVLALSGGRKAGFAGFNRALDALRPIGSLIKPVVYLLALSQPQRYTLLTRLDDRAVSLKDHQGRVWRPRNYDRKEHGKVPLHRALALSYNLASVRLGLDLGLPAVVRMLERMGVQRPVRELPSLLLGAVNLSPLEVAQIYQVLASGGFRAPLRAIREVTDADGQRLQRYELEVEQVARPGPVYLLNRNLVEVVRAGTARGLNKYLPADLQVAGKTGTTDNMRDSWFAGFSADKVVVAWIGRDDNKPMGLTGASGALKLWGRVMSRIRPLPLALLPPEEVDYIWVEPATGMLSAEDCPGTVAMPFIRGSAPRLRSECLEQQRRRGNGLFDWFD